MEALCPIVKTLTGVPEELVDCVNWYCTKRGDVQYALSSLSYQP